MEPLIKVINIKKTFIRTEKRSFSQPRNLFKKSKIKVSALKGISFEIQKGEIVGYIGPNGAGKSSTIKLLSGILTPSAGICIIGGLVPWKQRRVHTKNIGVVFGQKSQLIWDLPAIDSFLLLKKIYSIAEENFRTELSYLSDKLDFAQLLNTPVRQLSLGQRMRIEVAASLIHQPSILFLDEPTIGLDALSKKKMRELILSLNRERNLTVLLTTHDSKDIEILADRIIYINDGLIQYDGSLEKFADTIGIKGTSLDDALATLYQKTGE